MSYNHENTIFNNKKISVILMPAYEILLKTFTTRKIFYLNTINKFLSDTKTKIPALNNRNLTINGKSYRDYLEKLTSLKGASLHSSYIRQLKSLENDGILRKDQMSKVSCKGTSPRHCRRGAMRYAPSSLGRGFRFR